MLGATLSDNTNRTQIRTPAKTATNLRLRGRPARFIRLEEGGHATTLMPGAAMAALPQTGVTSWPTWWVAMGGQNQRENRTPLSRSRRNIANSQGGSRLSHCKATNPKGHRHHRPAGRRAKRALADHFTGRRRTSTHADGLQEFRSATGHRTRPRSR